MIVPMKKFAFLVYHSDYHDFLEDLRRLGLVHVQQRSVDHSQALQEEMEKQKDIRETLRRLRQRDVDRDDSADGDPARGREIVRAYDRLNDAYEKRRFELNALEKEIEFREPWGDFSIETLERLREAGLAVRLFVCPQKKFRQSWRENYPLEVIATLPPDVYFVIINLREETPEIDAEEIPPPTSSLQDMRERRDVLYGELEEIKKNMDELAADGLPALEAALHQTESSMQLIEVVESTREEAEGKIRLLQGFAPARQEEAIARFCADHDIPFLSERPTPGDTPPIKLENSRFGRLFEPIARLFALPSYGELDLTPFFAPFFMLFFGFCLGDAGYGLVVLLGATIYKRRAKSNLRPVMSLVQILGGATILFGILTGTVFGLNLLEDRFAYLGELRAFMLDSNETFNLALILGLVQILFGLLLRAINKARQFGWMHSIASIGWMILLLSLLDIGLLKLAAPATTYTAWGGVGLILLFNDPSAGILGRIGKGVWELYGITGIFGDLLSYIRLFALGISSAILGFVINDIALQIKGGLGFFGPVLFVIFLLIGHGLNLLIASLGAFVHPMRLTFVEFYKNAGFEGGGKAYRPFSVNPESTNENKA